ncbi:DNA-binding response OmpR family regulator [Chitinivorax tropicus]|uniref:DNA-binding response OmpR family regulator n=1 Tax=Chitinivorax tropicus TaxID=714531 RepID=A0A840MDM1_9PROT|nr:response regulator [Chitinivorax tropicus]MBB5016768.1 DNA-binding response OmpR family regulator [Chitinivorax tropicus]
MNVLLVEDDLALGEALSQALQQAGWRVVWVRRLKEARTFLSTTPPDALLLDLGLPDGEGGELLQGLRQQGKTLPIIVLTARDGLETRLAGLRDGADDFLVKPFAIPELLVRLQAVTRRSAGFVSTLWQIGPLAINTDTHDVSLADQAINLSPSEFSLLFELVRKAGKVVNREYLVDYLHCESDNALEVHVHNLRRKLGSEWVKTVRGVGYLMPRA